MNSDLLSRLDAWLSQNRAEFYRTLSPGVAAEALAQWERETMAAPSAGKAPADWFRVLPQTFRDLYLWKNGQSTQEVGFVDRFCFLPLATCGVGLPIPGVITFLDSESWRDTIGIDMLGILEGPEGRKPGQIISLCGDDMTGVVEYPSLEKWLEVLVTALEEGRAYTLDEPNARPPAPFGLSEPEVQKRLCPGYPGEEQNLGDLWV